MFTHTRVYRGIFASGNYPIAEILYDKAIKVRHTHTQRKSQRSIGSPPRKTPLTQNNAHIAPLGLA